MSEKRPLLSLCIPTYNRSYYLDLNLKQLYSNWLEIQNKNDIEILIFDNASTDQTTDIVNKYVAYGLPILYTKNSRNYGSDVNFELSVRRALGKYVWIFGDDEMLFNHTLTKILGILEKHEVGCVYVEGLGYDKDYDLESYNDIPNEEIQLISADEYCKKVHYSLTFCTGNIFNKSTLPENFGYQSFRGTNLIQVNWYLNAIKRSNSNIKLHEKYFFSKNNNTGGYQFYKTFSTNFNRILKENLSTLVRVEINNALINSFFYFHLLKATKFNDEKVFFELFRNYFSYLDFWTKIVPLILKNFLKTIFSKAIFFRKLL